MWRDGAAIDAAAVDAAAVDAAAVDTAAVDGASVDGASVDGEGTRVVEAQRAAVVELEHGRHVASARASFEGLARLAAHAAEVLPPQIAAAGRLIAARIAAGHKVLACGNGGSAADAAHFVGELVGRMGMERAALPAVSLCVDPAVLTCIGNDYGYAHLFARQVEGLGRPGDVLVALSTSGRSENVLLALDAARARGLYTVALVGERPDPRVDACDLAVRVPNPDTPRVQEIHSAALHAICDVVEQTLFA